MDPAETAKAHIVPQKSRKRLYIIIGITAALFLVVCVGIILAVLRSTGNESAGTASSAESNQQSAEAPAVRDTQESAAAVDTSSTQLDNSLRDATSALKDEPDYQKVGE